MTSMSVVVATVMLGVSLGCLTAGPRRNVLRAQAVFAVPGPQSGPMCRSPKPGDQLAGWMSMPRLLVGLLAGLVCWLLFGQQLMGVLVGAAAMPACVALLARLETEPERRRTRRLVSQLPGCLDLLAAALDAGVPLRAAVRHVAGLAPEPSAGLLRGVLGHLDIGRSDAQAWTTLQGHAVWGQTARDLARCADSGAAVAEVLTVHASEARARRRAQREAGARTVGVRSVLPLVCCFLPAFVLVGVVPIIAATLGSFVQPR